MRIGPKLLLDPSHSRTENSIKRELEDVDTYGSLWVAKRLKKASGFQYIDPMDGNEFPSTNIRDDLEKRGGYLHEGFSWVKLEMYLLIQGLAS